MRKPEAGETLYVLNIGNAVRGREQELTRMQVTKVGRKYFTVGEGWSALKFHLSDWSEVTDYSPSFALYVSPQEWEDEKEATGIRRRIREAVGLGGILSKLSLNALRAINQILDQAEETPDATN